MILSTHEDGVLWLSFNRTAAANALNLELYDALPEVLFDMPTPIGAAIISPRVSRRMTHRLVQLGERIGAAECLSEGLVSLVAPSEQLLDVTRARAKALAAIPHHAYALNKQWITQHTREELARASLLARSVLEH